MSEADAIVTYRGVVYPWQCDHMGHLNVMWYVGKFDEATWVLCSAIGLTAAYFREADRGLAAVRQELTYQRELVAGDTVAVRSKLLEVGRTSLRFAHEMINAETGEVAAVTELTGVHLDRGTRRSCPFPAAIAERARAMVSAPAR